MHRCYYHYQRGALAAGDERRLLVKEQIEIATKPPDDPANKTARPALVTGAAAAPKGGRRAQASWSLPQPAKTPAREFARVFVKAFHSLAVIIFGAAAVYLIYCGLTGERTALMVWALAAVALETVIYLGFGAKCPLTMLARWLGDQGGHDYLFEWLLGVERIGLVSRSLAALAGIGVVLILIGSFTPLL